jgi:hypothetical protein
MRLRQYCKALAALAVARINVKSGDRRRKLVVPYQNARTIENTIDLIS